MRRWTWLICAGLVLGSLEVASGQDSETFPPCTKTATKGDQEAAEGAFKAGFGSYQEGDYEKAITYWSDAYSRDCTAHALLLNLANAYERMGDKEKAVLALKTYLDRVKEAPNRPTLERRIRNLEGQIAAAAQPPPETKPAENEKPEPLAASAPPPSKEQSPTVQPDTAEKAGGGQPIAPWLVVGAGGAITLVGGLIYLGGKGKVSDAEELCPSRVDCGEDATKKGNDGRSQMNVGGIMAGVGLAAVAGGLAWQLLWNTPEQGGVATPSSTLKPTVQPDYAGLTLSGTF